MTTAASEALASRTENFWTALLAGSAWFGVLLQLYLVLVPGNEEIGFAGTVIRYFSYFTILTNLLAALVLTVPLVNPQASLAGVCRSGTLRTAVATYITVVAVVHATSLRGLIDLDGAGLLADTFLHVVTPVAYVVFWFMLVPKHGIAWETALGWLWFPAAYLGYVFLRGAVTGQYPYPFVDAALLGYGQAGFNSGVVAAAFLLTGLLFIAIDRAIARAMRALV